MSNVNSRIGILFLIAVLAVTAISFAPGLTTRSVQAACASGASWGSWANYGSSWQKCTYDLGCHFNPQQPDSSVKSCQRQMRVKWDRYGACATQFRDQCSNTGTCCQ